MDRFIADGRNQVVSDDLVSTEAKRQRPSIVEWKLDSRPDSVGIEASIACNSEGCGCGCA